MARTLQQLKESVEKLIADQGKDAPVAAFLFTKNDVTYEDDDYVEHHLNEENTDHILSNLEGDDWIYDQVFSYIENEVKDLKRRKSTL
jgi:hypothetical protein